MKENKQSSLASLIAEKGKASLMQRLTLIHGEIELALKAGVTRSQIIEHLKENGYGEISLFTFKTCFERMRKKAREAPVPASKTMPPAPPPETNPGAAVLAAQPESHSVQASLTATPPAAPIEEASSSQSIPPQPPALEPGPSSSGLPEAGCAGVTAKPESTQTIASAQEENPVPVDPRWYLEVTRKPLKVLEKKPPLMDYYERQKRPLDY